MAQCSSTADMQDSPDIFFDSQDKMDAEESAVISSTSKSSNTWRGAAMSMIYNGNNPWVAPEFPDIVPGHSHTVLYHISKSDPKKISNGPPVPQLGKDVWDKDFVRMPYSSQSVYPVEEEGRSVLKNRWNIIVRALSKPIKNSIEFENAVLEYNSKYRSQWKFVALHTLFEEYLEEEESEYFFSTTLPKIQKLVLRLPELIPSPIPLLRQNQNRSISLSQWQIACLLANAFFCTFPRRNSQKMKSEYSSFPDINFNKLFQHKGTKSCLEKLKCICHYFRRVFDKVPSGVVTFTRRAVEAFNIPEWRTVETSIDSVPLHVDSKGTIEDEGLGLLQVDFANKFLGGGVLRGGCVQEEIRFMICPELLISMLFTEFMKPNEALLMIGAERYSNYKGYANTFKWDSNHNDQTVRDSNGRLRCAIIAIDAISFRNKRAQYQEDFILRELNKAYVGYSIHVNRHSTSQSLPGVATGNWGCGAFCGSPHLKALIQLIACCVSRRPMVYFTFGDDGLKDDIANIYNFFSQSNISVGKLFSYLCEFYKSSLPGDKLYPFLLQIHQDKLDKKSNQLKPLRCDSIQTKMTSIDQSKITKEHCNEETPKIEKRKEIVDETHNDSDSIEEPESSDSFFNRISDFADTSSEETLVKRKRTLAFFDKGESKEPEKKVDNKSTSNTKKPIDKNASTRKSGKISDYFQPASK